jgi:FkbH-like protein
MGAYASVEEYLRSLDMEISEEPVNRDNCARVTQLINKTNQFNLTTRRYSEEQVSAMSTSSQWWCRCFRLRDRFADHGLIAVLLAEKTPDCWRVDTWLISCRVIGRDVEKFMFDSLVRAARTEQVRTIAAEYLPTAKNDPVKNLLPQLGFHQAAAGVYTLDAQAAA